MIEKTDFGANDRTDGFNLSSVDIIKIIYLMKNVFMKTVTRKGLDELAKIMPVLSEMEQRSFIGGTEYPPSGSHTQPYTWEEYDRMVASGNWNGGYIIGFGYMSPDVIITGDQRTASSFSGTALGYMFAKV